MIVTATDLLERAQPFASALVAEEKKSVGSKMAAYENVAASVGASASWLRKLVGRQPVDLAAHQYLNLALAYRSLCERIETRAEQERLRAAEAKERTNAAHLCAHLAGPRDRGAPPSRAHGTARAPGMATQLPARGGEG